MSKSSKNRYSDKELESFRKIIKLIKDHDLGIDAVSGEEINKSLNNFIKPKKIVFAGVG